jgi:23S rRNA (guanosine2251-2'-O)-methyltransferase
MTRRPPASRPSAGLWIYGLHPVRAALANPRRSVHRALLTPRVAEAIGGPLLGRVRHEIVPTEVVARSVPPGAVHQGAALCCASLPARDLDDIIAIRSDARRIVLVLDQITDPHNVGAILRSAAAFGAAAVVVQDRHAPPESGALAKAASGALDLVPYVQVVNISRALDQLGKAGFWRMALADEAKQSLQEATSSGDAAIVLGSEGAGLRRLVREHCDVAAGIPVAAGMESLNVSNAAAIALYELRRRVVEPEP